MCGIGGYLGPDFGGLSSLANSLMRSLAHRGPDDEGQQLLEVKDHPERFLLMVHTRLSILDLSKLGHQPMCDVATGNWIIYNGETYNFKELRQRLEHCGIALKSQSDTEVILKGYGWKRQAILNDLCGMFALALWDDSKRELILAVDPLGIKPLYYWTGTHGEFLFASEIRALLNTDLVPRRVDPIGLEGFLSYGAVQSPHTMIDGISALLPGTYLVVSADGKIKGPITYWSAPFVPANKGAVDNVEHDTLGMLEEVVRQHLISDVPVGAFLSGGIDSSAVVALASKYTSNLRSFSVTFEEQEFSEAPYSREVAKFHGLNHTELCLSETDLLSKLPAALDAMDQPTLDGMNVYVISQAVRDTGIKVVLSGQGGDEVFGGYSTFRQVSVAHAWRRRLGLGMIPPVIWRLMGNLWNAVQSQRRVVPDKLGQFLLANGDAYALYFLLRQLFPPSIRRGLFPQGGTKTTPEGLPSVLDAALRASCASLDPVNLVSLLEQQTHLENMLLRDGDFMSMAHGLEVRVPFLDRRIVEFMARLPGDIKLDKDLPKPLLLRPLLQQIPAAVYRRPKQGFTFPWQQWLRQQLRPLAEEALTDGTTYRGLGMQPQAVERLWHAFLDGKRGVSWSRIWALIVLREWAVRHRAIL